LEFLERGKKIIKSGAQGKRLKKKKKKIL